MNEVTKTPLEEILEDAKDQGLNIAEDAAKNAVEFIFVALPKAVTMIKNPTIQMIAGVAVTALVATKPKVMEWLDGIDGEVG